MITATDFNGVSTSAHPALLLLKTGTMRSIISAIKQLSRWTINRTITFIVLSWALWAFIPELGSRSLGTTSSSFSADGGDLASVRCIDRQTAQETVHLWVPGISYKTSSTMISVPIHFFYSLMPPVPDASSEDLQSALTGAFVRLKNSKEAPGKKEQAFDRLGEWLIHWQSWPSTPWLTNYYSKFYRTGRWALDHDLYSKLLYRQQQSP